MSLKFEIGQSSLTGPRARNEDYVGVVTPAGTQLSIKGALLAVADGVSGNAGGGEASEMTMRTVTSDYYATPDTWEPLTALDKVLTAANRWLIAQANANRDMVGMATTLSLLVLRGQRYYSAHVGDTRIYLLRDGKLKKLTTDHVWDRPEMRHVLKRAVGLDRHLEVDYADGALQVGDVFALMSDGVWDALGEQAIHKTMALYDSPQMICEELTKLAIEKGSTDNSTAVAARITQLGEETLSELLADGRHLIVPNKLQIGETIDDFEIIEVLYESRASLLYKVRHLNSRQLFVLKTLQPLLANDVESCNGLLNEEWLAKRVVSQYVPQVFPVTAEKRSKLYYVMSWHEGSTLQQRLDSGHHFTVVGVAKIGIDLLRGMAALHRLNIVHRDIKPDNIHQATDQRLRILDLGVALSSMIVATEMSQNPGTPSFMAPELFDGEPATVQSDIYAAGVTLYYLLTRKYPHGEIEPFQRPKFGEPIPPTRYRPDIPYWLENIILKAIARDLKLRFETAEEMLLALEHGELKPILAPARTPLIARARLVKWQWIAIFSFVLNLLLIYLLVVS
ncbi:MAG: bifunctional protein-serine/threonine kinase/phosphatase [Methylotenera sp.]|uniref:bifunctional protein-serine/threonine kinase/phosphatase n=1 Tax=Methylotenera sp. TaxID=2051956 RepID=UPI002487CDE0|nr:bifunctional protein-serine/threonine kinase/phosphatase [Methylotenera sp.]MDI1308814.1 bifunctional protein-serine/threonine kinase/phosphatase [Methylotenera sp.]